jgi:hypothetical protein
MENNLNDVQEYIENIVDPELAKDIAILADERYGFEDIDEFEEEYNSMKKYLLEQVDLSFTGVNQKDVDRSVSISASRGIYWKLVENRPEAQREALYNLKDVIRNVDAAVNTYSIELTGKPEDDDYETEDLGDIFEDDDLGEPSDRSGGMTREEIGGKLKQSKSKILERSSRIAGKLVDKKEHIEMDEELADEFDAYDSADDVIKEEYEHAIKEACENYVDRVINDFIQRLTEEDIEDINDQGLGSWCSDQISVASSRVNNYAREKPVSFAYRGGMMNMFIYLCFLGTFFFIQDGGATLEYFVEENVSKFTSYG